MPNGSSSEGRRRVPNDMVLPYISRVLLEEDDTLMSCSWRRSCSWSKAAKDNVVDVHTLLISCAQAVAANNHMGACELLKQIKKHASATGDATQRLAQCFTKGLEARLMGSGSQLWQLLMAYNLYFAAYCFNKVALSSPQ